jgi:hypothetical protein
MNDHPTSDRRAQHPQRVAKRHLSDLQQRMLQWLREESRRRGGQAEGVPFRAVVRALATDKVSVMTSLRQLLRKGLLTVTLPRGAWDRYIALTDEGFAQAHTLTKQTPASTYTDKRRRAEKRERDLRRRDRRWHHRG